MSKPDNATAENVRKAEDAYEDWRSRTGGAAFPLGPIIEVDSFDPGMRQKVAERAQGMTLRDYFAAKAMQALIIERYQAIKQARQPYSDLLFEAVPKDAYEIADEMLKAREAQ